MTATIATPEVDLPTYIYWRLAKSRRWPPISSAHAEATYIMASTWAAGASFTTRAWQETCAADRWRRFLCGVSPTADVLACAPTPLRNSIATRSSAARVRDSARTDTAFSAITASIFASGASTESAVVVKLNIYWPIPARSCDVQVILPPPSFAKSLAAASQST